MIAIGLMSGTSLDGVDAALVKIENEQFELLKFITHPYSAEFKAKIMRNLHDSSAKLSEICSLNFELGYKFLDAINELLDGTNYNYSDISFVASHGQTIFHNPKGLGGNIPSTLQIGEASVITYHTNIQVVSDFRVMDIVAGGEGAPLVPMSEYMIYRSQEKSIVLQNLGGIGNLTYIPKNTSIDDVIAFDTGPGNVMIDYFTNKYFLKPYDDGGKIALSGTVIEEVLEYLMEDEFVKRKPPKSTGREQYTKEFMEELAYKFNFLTRKKEDIITTITEFTVQSMLYNYKKYLEAIDLVIVNGGGSHNKYILKRLKEELNSEVITGDEYGIPSDAKEAIAFVVLGYLTLNNRWGNVKSATGAKRGVILGKITPKEEKMKVDLKKIGTEQRNPNTMDIDVLSTEEILKKINDEDKTVAYSVEKAIPNISKLVDRIVEAFYEDGRLIYMGAGTSGRIGIIDAVECRPTFGVSDEMVQCLMAGGENAFISAVEGAEDSREMAVEDLKRINLTSKDVVVGIAASGRTPYVLAGVEYAKSIGAATGCITTAPNSPLAAAVDFPVEAVTGSEALTGSTRMKSGTAQKMVTNMISTTSMIKMGKVYSNLMIDVQATNEKLVSRARSIVVQITGVSEEEAQAKIDKFGGVKPALLAIMGEIDDVNEVNRLLAETKGHLRNALKLVK